MNSRKFSLKLIKALFLAFIFSSLFISCDYIVDGDDTSYSFRPDVQALDGEYSGIGVTSRYRSENTDFIYIFRIVVPEANSSETPAEENIGVINQKAFTNNTFLFQDQYVTKDTKYKYKTIFHDSVTDEYFSSSWSNEITATTGSGPLVFDSDTVPESIQYDKTNAKITFNTSITSLKFSSPNDAVTDYIPTLVLNNSVCSRYFPLTDDLTAEKTEVDLRDLVSDDFLNVPLLVKGIVGMKIEYEQDEKTNTKIEKIIRFSSNLELDIDMDDADEIMISTYQGTGIYLPE